MARVQDIATCSMHASAGMVLGMAFTRVTAHHPWSAWALFWALTALHVW